MSESNGDPASVAWMHRQVRLSSATGAKCDVYGAAVMVGGGIPGYSDKDLADGKGPGAGDMALDWDGTLGAIKASCDQTGLHLVD